jgi:hypothetical protein
MTTYDPFPGDSLLGQGSPYRELEPIGPRARRKRLRANMAALDHALNNAMLAAGGDDIDELRAAVLAIGHTFARALESPASRDDDDSED